MLAYVDSDKNSKIQMFAVCCPVDPLRVKVGISLKWSGDHNSIIVPTILRPRAFTAPLHRPALLQPADLTFFFFFSKLDPSSVQGFTTCSLF